MGKMKRAFVLKVTAVSAISQFAGVTVPVTLHP